MAKTKQMGASFAKGGGSSGSAGAQRFGARPVTPGQTGASPGKGEKYACGGASNGMCGFSGAGRLQPGATGNPANGSRHGFAQGGTGKMAPNRGSQQAQPGKTSAY